MALRWYVVHVYSGFEKKVAASIREQAQKKDMSDKFAEILIPTEEVVEVRRGAKVN
nr:transcription termination/antitermination NusG family protein [Alphaproteobacteria bacterium]